MALTTTPRAGVPSETRPPRLIRRRRRHAPRARLGPLSLLGRLSTYLWIAFSLAIFVWMVFASLKDSGDVFNSPWAPPSHPQWSNYSRVWEQTGLGHAFVNSIVLVGGATLAVLALACPAAYALSRVLFRGARTVTLYFVIGMAVPAQTIVVPAFIAMSHLGLVDTLPGLAILYIGGSLPFAVFLLTGFFRTLPSELEEAAAIDGCGGVRTFVRIMLPLARPGVVTAGFLTAVGLWNETFLSLVFIQTDTKSPLSLSVLNLYSAMQYTSDWGGLFAGVCLIVLPVLGAYLWLGRRIVGGLTVGSGR